MKTYKAKSSAKRAIVSELIKKAGLTKDEANLEVKEKFTFETKDGGFWYRRIQEPKNKKEVPETALEEGNSRFPVTIA